MNKKKFATLVIVLALLFLPLVSHASLIPCTNTPDSAGVIAKENQCGFAKLIDLVNNVIDYILFTIAIPIAAIMFTYAGFKLVVSGGASEARTTAKHVFTNAVLGLVISGVAWLVVKLILFTLGFKGGAFVGL